MTRVYTLEQIRPLLENENLVPEIEEGFALYSEGKVTVPPVGELILNNPPGEVHIKYGFIHGDDFFLVKIASGFYENAKQGLNTTPGLMVLASQKTGEIQAVLLEEGFLTNLRTAVAGAVAAKYLAPHPVRRIAIFGTGVQAKLQLQQLRHVTQCREVIVWGRRESALAAYQAALASSGFNIETTLDVALAAKHADLLVTTTPAEEPYLHEAMVKRGAHITAVGSDTEKKHELATRLLGSADLVVADSIAQCEVRGEIHHAVSDGMLDLANVVELGSIVRNRRLSRSSRDQLSVADLTGVAVQDIAIATAAVSRLYRP